MVGMCHIKRPNVQFTVYHVVHSVNIFFYDQPPHLSILFVRVCISFLTKLSNKICNSAAVSYPVSIHLDKIGVRFCHSNNKKQQYFGNLVCMKITSHLEISSPPKSGDSSECSSLFRPESFASKIYILFLTVHVLREKKEKMMMVRNDIFSFSFLQLLVGDTVFPETCCRQSGKITFD